MVMTTKEPEDLSPLRRQAESHLHDSAEPDKEGEDAKLLHELQVHQIELELQNEELRKSQSALEESRSRYSDLYHHAPVGYVILSQVGIIKESNTTFARMVGAEYQELHGRAFADLLLPEDQGIFRARLRGLFKQPTDKHIEVRLATGSRTFLDVDLTAIPQPCLDSSTKGSSDQLLMTVTDISPRKKLEQDRISLQSQINQLAKEASLSRMAGAVAHNFNNMLAVVLGNLELALEMLPQGEDPIKELLDAQKAGRRAADIGSLMLTYLGQTVAAKEAVDLADLCSDSIPQLVKAKPLAVHLETDFPASGPRVKANGGQLRQIIDNLVANSLEAMEGRPGLISLALAAATAEDISPFNRFPMDWQPAIQDYACLTVSDDGCGIASDAMATIFDPFFTSKFPGRGMGLPVVLGILRSHNGCITVENRLGAGCTFKVYLPILEE